MTKKRFLGFWFFITIVALVLLTSAIGIAIDFQAFVSNITSETVGLLISVIVGLFVVDKYTAYYQTKQWYQVRNLTYKSIASHVCEIAIQMLIVFSVKDNRPIRALNEGRFKPNSDTVTAISQVIEELKKISIKLNDKTITELTMNLYEAIKWDLDQIQDILIPRIVQSSDDQEFINILIELDSSREELYASVISRNNVATNEGFMNAIKLLESCHLIYSKLFERWKI